MVGRGACPQGARTKRAMPSGLLDHRSIPLCVAALLAVGCGASAPVRPAIVDAAPTEQIDTGPTSYESEIGGMNEYAVDDMFKALARPIQRCFDEGLSRVEQLGGSFTVSFRVDRKGGTRWAYMSSSTIGDRATESCILDIVRSKTWPKPLSGEGLAKKTVDIEPSSKPHVLDGKRAKSTIVLAKSRTATCRKGVRGAFLATAYLEPDGRVRTAGLAPPDEKAESVVDCVIGELQKLKFSASGKLAKVTFEI